MGWLRHWGKWQSAFWLGVRRGTLPVQWGPWVGRGWPWVWTAMKSFHFSWAGTQSHQALGMRKRPTLALFSLTLSDLGQWATNTVPLRTWASPPWVEAFGAWEQDGIFHDAWRKLLGTRRVELSSAVKSWNMRNLGVCPHSCVPLASVSTRSLMKWVTPVGCQVASIRVYHLPKSLWKKVVGGPTGCHFNLVYTLVKTFFPDAL